jgi:hypothetical protein
MEHGYKITTTYETHDPKKVDKFLGQPKIGGMGLLEMLQDTLSNLGDGERLPHTSPFHVLSADDFGDDPITNSFKSMGGPEIIVAIPASKVHSAYKKLNNIKLSSQRNILRYAYVSLQSFLNKQSDAVKLERVAYTKDEKSSGYWQIESINALDSLYKFSDNVISRSFLDRARNIILSGNKESISEVSEKLKQKFASITPTEMKRVAYTTLATQDNEPYLLCPKGKIQGKGPVPMEISKCRENCIDSRIAKDGTVSCAYADWMKTAFQSHDEVMARLDVHRHPDNEENLLNLAEGERSKKLTEGEVGFEARFENSDRGANKVRGKHNESDSREKQLSSSKAVQWGHQQGDKPVTRPKQAQTDSMKTIDSQLPRKDESGNEYLEALLRKLNKIESDTESVKEDSLDNAGLYSRKGDMEESYAEQLLDGNNPISYRDEINKDKPEPKDSITHLLNKNISASKKVDENSREKELESHRQNNKYDKNIEALLSDTDEDEFGHQFSEDDLKRFAEELGLDYVMESKREEYDDVV